MNVRTIKEKRKAYRHSNSIKRKTTQLSEMPGVIVSLETKLDEKTNSNFPEGNRPNKDGLFLKTRGKIWGIVI